MLITSTIFISSVRFVIRHFFSFIVIILRFIYFFLHIDTFCISIFCHHCRGISWGSFAFQLRRIMLMIVFISFGVIKQYCYYFNNFLPLLPLPPPPPYYQRFASLLSQDSNKITNTPSFFINHQSLTQPNKIITSWYTLYYQISISITCLRLHWRTTY